MVKHETTSVELGTEDFSKSSGSGGEGVHAHGKSKMSRRKSQATTTAATTTTTTNKEEELARAETRAVMCLRFSFAIVLVVVGKYRFVTTYYQTQCMLRFLSTAF